jgi:hypothetical protein
MTNESAPASDNARELLTSVRDVTRQVRIAQRGTWFPLLVFAVIILLAIPVQRYSGHHLGACRSTSAPGEPGARVCAVYPLWSLVYWSAALVLAYVAIAGFYLYQSRRQGVGSRVQPYVVVGVVIAVLGTAATLWTAYHPPTGGLTALTQVVNQLHTPAAAIGLALLVLAWVERNRALVWFSLAYLVVALVPATYFPGANEDHPTPSGSLARMLIVAGVLLLGSAGFAMTRRGAHRNTR